MLNTPTPGRRNATVAAPYLQDGTATTLPETVRLIARYQPGRQTADENSSAIADFLNSLTSEAGGAGLLFNPAVRGNGRTKASAAAPQRILP
jgi:cytochrome c peroxidase